VPVNGGDGKLTGVLTLAREISPFKRREFELQQSKALLQAFLNGISDPMLMIDNDLRPVYLNRAASKAYSTTIQGQGGSICGPVLCDRKGQCEVCKVKTHLKRKKPVSFERRTAGSDRVEKIYLYPLSGKKDGLDGAVVRVADITEAKGLERHLIHSEKMNALGMLVAGMVHEINNPNSFITFNLPILRAYLEKIFLLLDSHPAAVADKDWFGMDYPAFRREIFNLTDNLSHGSSRIDNIISNLKSMTHPKEVSNRRKWVELFEVVDKAVMLCRNEVRKRVKVFEVKPPRPAIQLKTDPEALEQVIINLLINASHAADKRESWVRIEALLSKDKPNHAVIEVTDNGCGMTQETIARIFDPFFTTKGPGVGTGLGLSVSYNLIRQLGGQILVESKPEEGTRFKVVLPFESGAQAQGLLTTEKKILPDKGPYQNPVNVKSSI
jgi:signal transduction histidine kinase